jgi:site-specific DNA recombinase
MGVAVYARVSTPRQAQAQTIEQQLDRLVAAVTERGWTLDERHVYRDDGYSGAGLSRPGLDCLRDHAALAEVDLVVVTAPTGWPATMSTRCCCSTSWAGTAARSSFWTGR